VHVLPSLVLFGRWCVQWAQDLQQQQTDGNDAGNEAETSGELFLIRVGSFGMASLRVLQVCHCCAC
jgi:hypothetical protein